MVRDARPRLAPHHEGVDPALHDRGAWELRVAFLSLTTKLGSYTAIEKSWLRFSSVRKNNNTHAPVRQEIVGFSFRGDRGAAGGDVDWPASCTCIAKMITPSRSPCSLSAFRQKSRPGLPNWPNAPVARRASTRARRSSVTSMTLRYLSCRKPAQRPARRPQRVDSLDRTAPPSWRGRLSSSGLRRANSTKLDSQAAGRILRHLRDRVAPLDDPRSIGQALKGDRFGEFWRYRDYRVVARIEILKR